MFFDKEMLRNTKIEKILSEIENILSIVNTEQDKLELAAFLPKVANLDSLINSIEKKDKSYEAISHKIGRVYSFFQSLREDSVDVNVAKVLLRDIYGLILNSINDQNTVDEFDDIDITAKIIDEIPYLIFWKDKNGRYRGCNKALAQIAGFDSPKDMIGYNDTQMPWKTVEMLNYILDDQQIINSGRARLNFEESNKQANGEETYGITSKVPLKNKEGDIIGLLGIFQDITQRKKMEMALEESKKEIERAHKNIKDSINYASLIQSSILPDESLLTKYFRDYFITWSPKDIVGGDIYLFSELRHQDECLMMCVDCTGHGVPGAFVTMLVKAIEFQLLAEILNNKDIEISPAKILGYFNKKMKILLKQDDQNNVNNVGFDGGVIYYDKRREIVKFAGAQTPLFYIDKEQELKTIKGDRYSVGYKKCDMHYRYTEYILDVEEGMEFYITTDGFLDQNGGEKGFPFGKKRFMETIKKHHHKPMAEQQEIFLNTLSSYQGQEERNDDVTVIGLKI